MRKFDYNTKVSNINALTKSLLGTSEDIKLQVYGEDGLWKSRENLGYAVERLNPYIATTDIDRLYVGDSIDLAAELYNDNMSSISFTSTDPKVAKVNSEGIIQALKAGSCHISIVAVSKGTAESN